MILEIASYYCCLWNVVSFTLLFFADSFFVFGAWTCSISRFASKIQSMLVTTSYTPYICFRWPLYRSILLPTPGGRFRILGFWVSFLGKNKFSVAFKAVQLVLWMRTSGCIRKRTREFTNQFGYSRFCQSEMICIIYLKETAIKVRLEELISRAHAEINISLIRCELTWHIFLSREMCSTSRENTVTHSIETISRMKTFS